MVDDYRLSIISNLRNIINEMKYLSCKQQIEPDEKTRLHFLYEQKNYLVHELIMLSSSYYLVDSMFQQEIKNHVIYKQYYYTFLLNHLLSCFNCKIIQLPEDYKNPYDCGHFDVKTKQPLLRKILNI